MSVSISIKHAVKRYGENTIIPDLSLEINKGEFFTLLGSSGCGKTTLLRMIAGFNTIEGGEFYFNDKLINDIPRDKRNIGMVFQNYAIFPHMTTFQNVAFGLEERKIKDPEKTERVNEMLEMVQISSLRDRKPQNMSGGQQQRIALARAIVIRPDVLLMDEPLSNLDAKLRVEMRSAIRDIQKKSGITTVYVTHDQSEALAVSDRIAIMNKGVIMQTGTPLDVYRHPENLFAATFIGESNVLDCTLCGNKSVKINETGYSFELDRLADERCQNAEVVLSVRPDEFVFSQTGIKGKVVERTFLGTDYDYVVELENNKNVKVSTKSSLIPKDIGENVCLSFDKSLVNVFDHSSEKSIMNDII